MNLGGQRASELVLLSDQEPSKSTTLNDKWFCCCLLGIALDATRTLVGLRIVGVKWLNHFVEAFHLSIVLLLPAVSSASWIDSLPHPRRQVLEAAGLPGGTPIGIGLQVWVGLIKVHHLIAFADATTGDDFLDENLLIIHLPYLPNTSPANLDAFEIALNWGSDHTFNTNLFVN